MNVAFDLDGTIDAAPGIMQSLCSALMAAGHHVFVITGVESKTPTKQDQTNKASYLTGLGFGKGTFSTLIVIGQPHDKNKAQAIKDNDIEILFDNSVANVKAAKGLCECFLLYNNKVKN